MLKLRKKDWTVRPIQHQTCKRLISEHHYAQSLSLTSTARYGLFRKGQELFDEAALGCSVWLPPAPGVMRRYSDFTLAECLALTRLAISPDVPSNGASFLIGQSIKQLKKDRPNIRILVTYADTMQSHTGAIYRATNWTYDGLTTPQPRWVDASGNLVSSLSKTSRSRAWMDSVYERVESFPMHRYYMVL